MSSLPRSPQQSPKVIAILGIGLLFTLPLLAQLNEQSPVDISRSNTLRDPNPPQIDFNYAISNVTLTNTYGKKDETGRVLAQEWATLKAFPESGSAIWLNGILYDLVQFHFHAPAEHTVNGRRPDMEVHFVHLIHDSRGDAAACASSNRPLVVLGAFIDASGSADVELQRLFPPDLPETSVPSVNLRALLPSGSPTWRYEGGLTAPADDCPNFAPLSTQAVTGDFPAAVHWFIYEKSLHLPRRLMERYNVLFPAGNSRSVKAIGARTIFFSNRQQGDEER